MSKFLYTLMIAGLSLTSQAWLWNNGKLTVNFSDNEGKPIANATLVVMTPNSLCGGRGGPSDYTQYTATSDDKGVAVVKFNYMCDDFYWYVDTPNHHDELFRPIDECFNSDVEEEDLYGNGDGTPESAARIAELKKLAQSNTVDAFTNLIAKLQPTRKANTGDEIVRSVSFFPKRNPQPMCSYAHSHTKDVVLPMSDFVQAPEEGPGVENWGTVEYDFECGKFLRPWGSRDHATPGKIGDVKLVRYHTNTNGVDTLYGYMEFPKGCGAYKRKMTGDQSMLTDYAADTNAVFASKIPFRYHLNDGKLVEAVPLLAEDEYFVCRNRVVYDDNGSITNCHYSKIIGDLFVGEEFEFKAIIFNPRPNDPNLEFDIERNMAGSKGGWGGVYCP